LLAKTTEVSQKDFTHRTNEAFKLLNRSWSLFYQFYFTK